MHYVVGDVHGCYDDLMAMIQTIEERDKEATIIFVGDFIDRGPKVWETLNWFMDNITPDGKYQTVLGNHEDMVIKWYYECLNCKETGTEEEPFLYYGFDKTLINNGVDSLEEAKPIIEFLEFLPLYKQLNIEMASGMKQGFIIAHAFVPKDGPKEEDYEDEKRREVYLWSRDHLKGYRGEEILIHGHTPTIDEEYRVRAILEPVRPGFIAYMPNAINVDGGCAFNKSYVYESPCMLCAICLETLEEIYPYDWQDRIAEITRQEKESGNIRRMTEEEYHEYMTYMRIERVKVQMALYKANAHNRRELLIRTGLKVEEEYV